MTDRLPDELLDRLRTASHPSHDPPREEMWQAIEARLGAERSSGMSAGAPSRGAWYRSPALLGLAASIVLLAGIAIGRGMVPGSAGGPEAVDAAGRAPSAVSAAVRTVALGHLASTETLLSFIDADIARGELDRELTRSAAGLLRETRMLLDVVPEDQPRLRLLLEDLEVLLTQVALLDHDGLDQGRRAEELELLAEGLRGGDVMGRIQTVLPAMGTEHRGAD